MNADQTFARRLGRASAAMIIASLLVAACGDDDDTAAEPPGTTTTVSDGPAEIEVTAIDYGYEDLPAEVRAGTALALRNASTTEVHELVALRLPDDESRAIEELLALPMAELEALFEGMPALVAIAPPGEGSFNAVGDGRLTEPGRYAIVCFIPTGAEPGAYLDALQSNPGEPPQIDGGAPHFTGGMFAELTVS